MANLEKFVKSLIERFVAWLKQKLNEYLDAAVKLFFKLKITVGYVSKELMAKVYVTCRFQLKWVNVLVTLGGMIEMRLGKDLAVLLVS